MSRTALIFFLRLGLIALLCPLSAQANIFRAWPGAQDHPLISRFEGSTLFRVGVLSFERVEFSVSPTQTETVEGRVFNYRYVGPKDRSDLEVFRNFKQALENNNFNIRFACEESKRCHEQQLNKHAAYWTGQGKSFEGGYYNAAYMHNNSNFPPRFLVAQSKRASGLVTVILTVQPPSSTEQNAGVGAPYFLQVIETAEMQTGQVTVNAQALSKGLAAEGKIALYGVYFDTNKSVILPTSKAQLDEMAAFLTQNKAVKVIVVGHTDNQGTTDGNLSLSQKRAEAVVHALVTEYKIDPQRLQSRGVANFSPVASNTSESGRSKNRRVELVEQ